MRCLIVGQEKNTLIVVFWNKMIQTDLSKKLYLAIKKSEYEKVVSLIEQKADVNERYLWGKLVPGYFEYPIQTAVVYDKQYPRIFNLLLNAKADINVIGYNRQNCLHFLVLKQYAGKRFNKAEGIIIPQGFHTQLLEQNKRGFIPSEYAERSKQSLLAEFLWKQTNSYVKSIFLLVQPFVFIDDLAHLVTSFLCKK